MGWCSGTDIFDVIADIVLIDNNLSNKQVRSILKALIEVLDEHDWDCQADSKWYNDRFVGSIFEETGDKNCE